MTEIHPAGAGKFNSFIPEWSTGPALCFVIDRPISAEGFEHNFMPRLEDAVSRYNEARILLYFKDFRGWEEEAAAKDIAATLRFGKYVTRIALVDPSEKLMMLFKLKQIVVTGETRFFSESELQDAIGWVNNP